MLNCRNNARTDTGAHAPILDVHSNGDFIPIRQCRTTSYKQCFTVDALIAAAISGGTDYIFSKYYHPGTPTLCFIHQTATFSIFVEYNGLFSSDFVCSSVQFQNPSLASLSSVDDFDSL